VEILPQRVRLNPNGDQKSSTMSCRPDSDLKERMMIMKRLVVLGIAAVLFGGTASAQDRKKMTTPDVLKAEIEALKADTVAWRAIAWKSCLLEGLNESRARNKPALLWVFIDRPADDARC
jgi:hypothetical protein